MKIIGISSVRDEQEIIGATVSHLLGEGVDQCIVSTGGGTPNIWKMKGVLAVTQQGPFDQGAEITRLAYLAAGKGTDWIVPFDADELWVDPLGGTIRSVLEALPSDCLKVHCAVFKHADWDRKYVAQNPLGKVCFRPSSEMTVHWGNHDVTLSQAGNEEHGLLEIRELQYRDFSHFVAKVAKAKALFDSWEVPEQHGHHMRALCDSTDLAGEWARITAGETVHDPIDFRGTR